MAEACEWHVSCKATSMGDPPRATKRSWVLLWLVAVGCATAPKPALVPPSQVTDTAVVPKPELAPREDLPVEAHEVLRVRMMRHGDQMGAMMLAVVLLDYEVVRLLTDALLREPNLGRPTPDDKHSLNALLPASFFVHQDALRKAAQELARAAEQTDDQKLVAAFNGVSRTCVDCHSAYLHEALVEEGQISIPCELEGSCDEEPEPAEPSDWRGQQL
jgi:hypothetical protein